MPKRYLLFDESVAGLNGAGFLLPDVPTIARYQLFQGSVVDAGSPGELEITATINGTRFWREVVQDGTISHRFEPPLDAVPGVTIEIHAEQLSGTGPASYSASCNVEVTLVDPPDGYDPSLEWTTFSGNPIVALEMATP